MESRTQLKRRVRTERLAELERLLMERKDVIDKASQELATNFAIPGGQIIAAACAELGISRKEWDKLQVIRQRRRQGAWILEGI